MLLPKSFYLLEADDPSKLNRPHYAYTPQPNWNIAYSIIKENIEENEIIISSHPHFNKIFLERAGYWIKYNYLGIESTDRHDNQEFEYYVGARIIHNLEELIKLINNNSGYLIFDFMAIDGKIDGQIINYIKDNLELFYYDEVNSYSKIWVYKF